VLIHKWRNKVKRGGGVEVAQISKFTGSTGSEVFWVARVGSMTIAKKKEKSLAKRRRNNSTLLTLADSNEDPFLSGLGKKRRDNWSGGGKVQ